MRYRHRRFFALRRRLCGAVVPCLAALCLTTSGTAMAGEGETPPATVEQDLGAFLLNAAQPSISGSGVIHARSGFVLQAVSDGRLISGNALRYDLQREELYARGQVVMAITLSTSSSNDAGVGIRLEAEELGLRRLAEDDDDEQKTRGRLPFQGEARGITAWIPILDGTTLRVEAERARFFPDRIELLSARVDAGHGSILGFHTAALVIGLFPEEREHREGVARHVEDITLWRPSVAFEQAPFGLPLLWLPVMYRDFRLKYPWTRYRFGRSRSLGYYTHAWFGSDLPPLAIGSTAEGSPSLLRSRLHGRYNYHSLAGQGYGLDLAWQHPQMGEGRVLGYTMPNEAFFAADNRSYRKKDGVEPFASRRASSVDVEHRWSQGSIAAYGRYVSIPDADPLASEVLDPPSERRPPSDRFRADYLGEDIERDPSARRGLAVAYSTPWLSAVTDSEWKHHPHLNETEREIGVQLTAPPLQLGGPLHLDLSGWAEQLRRETPEQLREGGRWAKARGQRFTYDGALEVEEWFDGIGLDLRSGIRGNWERNGELERWQRSAGTALQTDAITVDSQHRWQPYVESGISLRMVGMWDEEIVTWTHIFTPRLGVELAWRERGVQADDWQDLGFGGARSRLPRQQQLLTAGFNTSLSRNARRIISADLVSRWSWRAEDRVKTRRLPDNSIGEFESATRLVQMEGRLSIAPSPLFSINGNAAYDFIFREWSNLSGRMVFTPHRRFQVEWESILLPESVRRGTLADRPDWEHTVTVSALGNRYGVSSGFTMRPQGRNIDVLSLAITRSFTDGTIELNGEYSWDENGENFDRRIGLSINLYGLGGLGQGDRDRR